MGYLTDPSGFQSRSFRLVLNHQKKICVLLYLGSIFWYCMLPHDQISAGTYLSENALLPGLVVVDYNEGEMAKNLLNELEEVAETERGIPSDWLLMKMAQSGLQVFSHNFTLNYPLKPGVKYSGRNVYGMLRGAGTEAVVLNVPYRPPSSAFPSTSGGLALVLSLAHYFRRQNYWAKDIIFLFTEYEQLGVQAWLEAYHQVSCGTPGVVLAGDVEGRAGAIQAAVTLELGHLSDVNILDVKLAGLNGQLPNLDLYNLVHRICHKEGVAHTFDRQEKMNAEHNYINYLATMSSMVLCQASGVPDGNHGLFHRFGIEAVSIEGLRSRYGRQISYHKLGRIIEGVFRSVNNLLERFHQSYFFYLLTDFDQFISISYYMLCVGMLAGSLFIKAFKLYLDLRFLWIDQFYSEKKKDIPDLNPILSASIVMSAFGFGVLVHSSPVYIVSLLSFLPTEDALFYGFIFVSLLSVIFPLTIAKRYKDCSWWLVEMCVEVILATLLVTVAMHNFSLALIIGVIVTPAFLALSPKNNWLAHWGLVLAVHPAVILTAVLWAHSLARFGTLSLGAIKEALALSVVDSHIYGNHTLQMATFFYLPCWLLAWLIVNS